MRIFIAVLVLTFSLQTWTKADDISDFEIEGMSIGDSLLDYFSKNEIRNNNLNYFSKKRKYYVAGFIDESWMFDQIEVYLKHNDKKYKIRTIAGMIVIKNLDECLSKKKEIVAVSEELFANAFKSTGSKPNEIDKTGNSMQYVDQYLYDKDNHIRIECMQWSQKMKIEKGFVNTLNLVVMSDEISNWISSGYK